MASHAYPHVQHQNADGLSKRTQDLELKEEDVVKEEGMVLLFLSAEQERDLPVLVMDDEGQIKRLMVRPLKGLEEPLTNAVVAEVKDTRFPFMSVAQQAQIEPRVPWMGPVAMEACRVIQMGPRYDVPFLKQKQEADPVLQAMKELLRLSIAEKKVQEPLLMSKLNLTEKRWFTKNKDMMLEPEQKREKSWLATHMSKFSVSLVIQPYYG